MRGPRKFRDVLAGILEGDEAAPAGQRYGIFKPSFPAAMRQATWIRQVPR